MQSREHYCQEIEEHSGGFEFGTINHLAMLTTNEPPLPSTGHCTMCASSTKRRSPYSSSHQEPTPKKQLLTTTTTPSSSSAAAATNKLTPSSNYSLPILRRSVSDPINSPGINHPQFLNPQSPENATLLPHLRRSFSDLNQSPFPPIAARTSLESPNSGELGSESNRGGSPSSRRLRRMKDRMKEMIRWWDEVMTEGEEENGNENYKDNNTESEKAEETETEEAVSVERTGECLVIHFKCPCNKGYQILLYGSNCYYKLM